ncbi:MAG: Sensor protein [uncultured bacterium]|nr:MAG: Sensor protein [uncultured bacterium]OGN55648.1 MAG: hypothetical protein A2796_00535 [Chlamydiae bacterium RIFCSPHIGHO2_01_FULL_44_39]OGN57255.1 MAG: hypothetical protein A3C42_04380 [Chlamydiae bacterium RIFCSPHIGHO2_02_FULL_45_9]OGN60440.1 MAG: hypothetical protein A3D96_00960 [Chlamydiae bacterium RIFCSPHIGHO2_12_FULL_44_59]OGN66561.1 MAG: hypothetical protein A2978_05145 [Chlamydiae bacterium RIFCSPLOWO2_01_FULL_44_52]OGN69810.1 MAG: hypothetical protein A3I67_06900 [Chlamydiae ba
MPSLRKKIILRDIFITCVLMVVLIPVGNFMIDVMFARSFVESTIGLKNECKVVSLLLCLGCIFIHRGVGTYMVSGILKPIQQILSALRRFEEGKEELLPQIVLHAAADVEEFRKLASILNAQTNRIQKQIEHLTKQKEETKQILESLGEGIVALDPSAKVTFANAKACQMLHIPPVEILGKRLDSTKTKELTEKCHDLIVYALQTTEPASYLWNERGDRSLYLELSAAPLAYQDGALLVLQDKTSDYQIIGMGKDFIANASHELRTPITIIRGFAETLQDVPDLSSTMKEEIIEKIVRTCIRLDKLVRSLLILTDVENLPKDRLKTTDLIPLVDNCIHLMKTANPTVLITSDSAVEEVFITADADLLELAILNILENGIKYAKGPPQLEISIQKEERAVQLKIRDNGIGIPESDLARIFDRFYTVNKARSRKSGGAGLGLSIVKTIVEKHSGAVHAESIADFGSVFTLTFPIKRSIL